MADLRPRTARNPPRAAISALNAAASCLRRRRSSSGKACTYAVKSAQRDVADRRRHLPGEIKFRRRAKTHGFAGIEKNSHRQFPFLLVELQKEFVQPAVKVPVQIAEIIPGDVVTIIGEFDRLAAGLCAVRLGRNSWRAAPPATGIVPACAANPESGAGRACRAFLKRIGRKVGYAAFKSDDGALSCCRRKPCRRLDLVAESGWDPFT